MNDFYSHIRELFTQEGFTGIVSGISRWIYWRLRRLADPFYQVIKPATQTFKLGPASAMFDMEEASLVHHDFRADLQSEQEIIQRLIESVDADDVFFDVGANVGIYSLLIGDVLSTGMVISFEPHPDRVSVLRRNIDLNNSAVEIRQIALSDESGEMELVSSGSTRHHLAWDDNVSATKQVEAVPGDDIIENGSIPDPDVIKIDIEGAEMMALRGLNKTLRHGNCRTVFCEVHPNELDAFGESSERPESFLQERGYNVTRIDNRKENYFIQATR